MWKRPVCCALGLCLFIAAAAAAQGTSGVDSEAVRWLREYIQIATVNPPGNEAAGAEYLASIFKGEGLEAQRLATPEGRTSLYLRRTSPTSEGRALVLMHHIDVVAANDTWQVPPFSGRLHEGRIWGRGALDVKGLGIAQMAAIVDLHRRGVDPGIDLIFLAVADEEAGGKSGAGWLLDNYPQLFAGTIGVLNEGGSNRVVNDRLVWWGVEVVQKRPLWLKVSTRGRGGHASGLNPGSATHQLVAALARLLEEPLRYRVSEAARIYFRGLAALEANDDHLYHRLDEVIQEDGPTIPLAPGVPAFFVDTVQVTEIRNGTGSNIISPQATARIDIRLLPDTDSDAFLESVRQLLGERVHVDVVLDAPEAPPSPLNHVVFQALESALGVRGPVTPTFMTGTTDSRYFRQRGIAAYGFSPFALNADEQRGIHAVDESIPADGFLRGIEMLKRVIVACGRGAKAPAERAAGRAVDGGGSRR